MWKFSWWSHSEKTIAGYCFTHLSKRSWKMVEDTCFWHLTHSSLRLEFLLCPVTAQPSSILHAPTATFCQHWLCLPVSSGCAMFLSHILGSHRPCSSYCSHSLLITSSTVRNKHRSLPPEHEFWDCLFLHDILSIILNEHWKRSHNTWVGSLYLFFSSLFLYQKTTFCDIASSKGPIKHLFCHTPPPIVFNWLPKP